MSASFPICRVVRRTLSKEEYIKEATRREREAKKQVIAYRPIVRTLRKPDARYLGKRRPDFINPNSPPRCATRAMIRP